MLQVKENNIDPILHWQHDCLYITLSRIIKHKLLESRLFTEFFLQYLVNRQKSSAKEWALRILENVFVLAPSKVKQFGMCPHAEDICKQNYRTMMNQRPETQVYILCVHICEESSQLYLKSQCYPNQQVIMWIFTECF